MEIYLIRHTAVHNPEKLCYGQSEIELAESWETDFNHLTNKLGLNTAWDIMFSSPYKRCSTLAAHLSGNQFIVDQRICEMNFGAWESCAWSAIEVGELHAWMNDFVKVKAPNGESFEEMHERCRLFWEEILSKPYKKVIIITHAGIIRSILARILHIPLEQIFSLQIDYSSVNKITLNKSHNSVTVNYINR